MGKVKEMLIKDEERRLAVQPLWVASAKDYTYKPKVIKKK